MRASRWIAALALSALGAVPATAQQHGQMHPQGQERPGMGAGMMQMCHAMMAGDSAGHRMMGGPQSMAGHEGMMGTGMMSSGMMGRGSGMMGMTRSAGPAALLGAAEALALTPEQTSRLEDLVQTAEQSRQQHMQAARAAQERAAQALQGDAPDLQGYEQALQEASRHMVEAHVAATLASLEANELLTPEQRAEVEESVELMGRMTCGQMMHGTGPAEPAGDR